MQIKELKSEGLSHELEVTIPANDIDKRVDARLAEVGKTVRLPGFRPGKAPMKILKQRYGTAVMGEVLEAAVNETSAKALEEKKIKPALQPKIEVKSFDLGEDLVYTVNVDAVPDFKVADFKSLKLEKPVAKVTDKDINESIEKLAENRQDTKPVETKRAAKDGDVVVIDFAGRTADDDVAHEGMQAEGHHLRLGSNQFIPGFEEQLTGKKAGDKIEVKVTFPENYQQDLAGRDAIFDVTVHELREPAETKVDDELAKSFGMDNLDALKDAVKQQLEQEFDQYSQMHVKKAVLDFLDEKHKFDIPPSMLEMEHQSILDQVEASHNHAPGETCLSDEEKEEYKEIADRRVRLGLVLSEIGNGQGITISDAELQKAVITEAQKYPGQEKAVFDYYSQNRQALEGLRGPIFEQKVVDYILELAEITEKEVSADELMTEPGAEEEAKPKKKAAAKKSTAKKSTAKKADDKPAEKKPAAKKKAPAKKKAASKK